MHRSSARVTADCCDVFKIRIKNIIRNLKNSRTLRMEPYLQTFGYSRLIDGYRSCGVLLSSAGHRTDLSTVRQGGCLSCQRSEQQSRIKFDLYPFSSAKIKNSEVPQPLLPLEQKPFLSQCSEEPQSRWPVWLRDHLVSRRVEVF